MNPAHSPRRKCIRCDNRNQQHFDGKCADGRDFKATFKNAGRNSQSFAADEIEVLRALCRNAERGATSTVLTRSRAYLRLAKKVLVMAERIEARKHQPHAEVA